MAVKPYRNSLPGFNAAVSLLVSNKNKTEGYSRKYKAVGKSAVTLAQGNPCPPCTPCTLTSEGWRIFCYGYVPGIGCIPDSFECQPPNIIVSEPYCSIVCPQHRWCCPNGVDSPDCCQSYKACCSGF
jgi:hypothetical protein